MNEEQHVPEQNTRLPLVAIVGRPNVGKSTLFNRLVGSRKAIVEDFPGVTRDRHYAEANLDQKRVILVDTGGIASDEKDPLWSNVREQSLLAMEEADLVLFVVDGHAGLLPDDSEIWNFLRQSALPCLLVVNKVDGPKQESIAAEFFKLGTSSIYQISSAHGRGFGLLMEAMEALLPMAPPIEDERPALEEDGPIHVAIVGRPNVGKSSLVNRLLGEERMVVADYPGTTRDSIDTKAEIGGREYVLIDTAGIRRKRSIDENVERLGVAKALQALDRSNVAVLLLDGEEGIAEQDAKIAGFAHEKGKAIVVAINKWDLGGSRKDGRKEFEEQLNRKLNWLSYAPVVYISAKTGLGVGRLLSQIQTAYASYLKRITTGELNRALEDAFAAHQPPTYRGHRLRMHYASQVGVAPPSFVLHTNYPEGVHFSYERYLHNFLRERFGFEGTPLKLFFKKRQGVERQ